MIGRRSRSFRVTLAGLLILFAGGVAILWGQQTNYTLYTPDGKRTLAVLSGSPETIALEQLAAPFGLTFTEDKVANGLVITTRKGRIVAVPGQSFIQVAGRGVVALDGPIRRDRNAWIAPIDFLTKGLGPALGEPVVIRRASRLVLVGNVRVPQVAGKVERTQTGARIEMSIEPATPHRVTRDGNKLTIRFDAAALDVTPLTGFIAEFASAARVDGTSIVIDLGPSAFSFKTEDDRDGLNIELAPQPPPPPKPTPTPTPAATPGATPGVQTPPAAPPAAPAPAPGQIDLAPGVRTIVIDPGHGGDDAGVKGTKGALEKDMSLAVARRLKSAIETRLGIRVLLTRDSDETLAVDKRAAFANNNKADLFLSLHANASIRPAVRGAQVYTLDVANYPKLSNESEAKRRTVPLLGGGSRVIDAVPWELAQLPFAEHSATFSAIVVQHFGEKSVVLHGRPNLTAPLRALAGANMPAVLIELGFLSNAEDEASLGSPEGQTAIVEALLAAIADVRRGFAGGERHRP